MIMREELVSVFQNITGVRTQLDLIGFNMCFALFFAFLWVDRLPSDPSIKRGVYGDTVKEICINMSLDIILAFLLNVLVYMIF